MRGGYPGDLAGKIAHGRPCGSALVTRNFCASLRKSYRTATGLHSTGGEPCNMPIGINLIEGRFRSYWDRTAEHGSGNERIRFTAVAARSPRESGQANRRRNEPAASGEGAECRQGNNTARLGPERSAKWTKTVHKSRAPGAALAVGVYGTAIDCELARALTLFGCDSFRTAATRKLSAWNRHWQ
jgi:hypothetical protein